MIKYDEFGNPLPPGYDETIDSMMAKTTSPEVAQAEEYAANPTQSPFQMNPQRFLKEAYGIGTTGPKADQFTHQAQEYQTPSTPQQFGQDQQVDPTEGPLSPQATAEVMPNSSDAMTKLIRQHMLPSLPQASRDGYQNYVTASRQNRAAEKDQLRQQGAINRADAAAKDQNAWDQTLRLNGLQGNGTNSSMGSSGPSVTTIGGYRFVSGQWRPQTPEEQAKTRLLNSQADYFNQRPEIEGGKQGAINDRLASRIAATAEENDKKLGAQAGRDATKQQSEADKQARAVRAEFDKFVNALRERDATAAEQVEANTPSKMWNYVPFSQGSKPPYREQFLDNERDPKHPGKYIPSKETYASIKDRVLTLADQLEKMHLSGVDVGQMPDDVIDMITQLRNR